MVTLYGTWRSRASRSLWMLAEVGIDFQHVRVQAVKGGVQDAAFRKLYPFAKVPLLVDGELVLPEAMAINLHLARKYGGVLWPESEHDQSQAERWSFFAMCELDPHMLAIGLQGMQPAEKRNESLLRDSHEALQRALSFLDAQLEQRSFLVGDRFTVADLNVAAVLDFGIMIGLDFEPYRHLWRWLDASRSRPSYARAVAAAA